MTVAVALFLRSSSAEDNRIDFAGRDCANVDEALGHVREVLTLQADEVVMAFVYPGRTVAEVMAMPEPPPVPHPDNWPKPG